MKKILFGLFVVSVVVLTGCNNATKDAEIADLSQKIDALQQQLDDKLPTEEVVAPDEVETPNAEATYITLTSPAQDTDFTEEPITFTGVVSPNATKIVVNWSVDSFGQTYDDVYRLQNFKYGDSKFNYGAKVSYKNLQQGANKYTFTAYFDDGTTKSANVQIYYSVGGAEMGKPVIYLYPKTTTPVSVNVVPQGGISVSEPAIGKGWNVIATPNGKIFNLGDFKSYPYLFWEGFATTFVRPSEGFVVKKENVAGFFDEKLAILGLNEKETADFKEYWVPKLAKDPYYFVTFVPQEQFEKYAPLTVSPKPDSVIRVFFDYQGYASKPAGIIEQKLVKQVRKGFAVVEWGGRLY
ncbi:hypothetical protein COV81_05610 [Candidatus Peregrinibacteria bacterium CG11_big_fil_rev_8_21_14_0_20_41_10]|nr:MAG: hypothetical protein COV81_05610 [Candidatus Peregrinibacteria bacterium CG11_big_fil_rev_8_21_14_0_20_41_10]PIZ75378.1 MAG: hypothetical protein COY06_03045 [Candidatus Peregrinibacteria bacterium CG_4_10_14_0_2_um_filter_41_8]PJC38005.1 MAG: hypothetical protein CO045_02550 [Candidatus Peregrinibacteria bacterium CG_4_9_14_0_2_um_filter_41_14]